MKKLKIGVICPSNIAYNRFMPSLLKLTDEIEFIGVAHANEEEWFGKISSSNNLSILDNDYKKCSDFVTKYGGKVFDSFHELLSSSEIDCVYLPLPPALHYKWAKIALENNKHVFLEKPFTDSYNKTKELIEIAKEKKLALHENYMFIYHKQIDYVNKLIENKELGNIRLISIYFGFPFRGANDFRYNKSLGGGALLDCGGYTFKLSQKLLGDSCKLAYHKLNYLNDYDVDIYGCGCFENDEGINANVSFGMDNCYRCDLEIWGSTKVMKTNRIFTAPKDFKPVFEFNDSINNNYSIIGEEDDSFKNSIMHFINLVNNVKMRDKKYEEILKQASFVEQFKEEK